MFSFLCFLGFPSLLLLYQLTFLFFLYFLPNGKVVINERLLLKEIKELCQENIYWTLIVILFPYLKGIGLCCKSGGLQEN